MKYIVLLGIGFCLASCSRTDQSFPLVAIQIQDRNGLIETITTPERIENYEKIDFLSSHPYKKVLRVFKNQGKSHSKITTYHSNGSVFQYLEAEDFRAHGAYREWYPNGQLRIEAMVIGGTADVALGAESDWLFDGTSQVWDEQGNLIAEIVYSQGDIEGKSIYYYSSGQIEKEHSYHKNTLEGLCIEYHLNGKVRSKTNYHEGSKQGASLGFFDNEQVCWIEEYTENLILTGSYYDIQGRQIAEVQDGNGFQAVYDRTILTHLMQIRQGFREGGVQQFTPQGGLRAVYHVKNGKKQGEELLYYALSECTDEKGEPLPKMSIQWDQDRVHGAVKSWYSTGQIQSQREYSRNKRQGSALAWYANGSLMLIEEYEDDHLLKGQYYKNMGKDPVSSVLAGNGVATLFDEEGVFLRKVVYARGEPLESEK